MLKNAIDWLSTPAPDGAPIGKPVALIGASSGRWGTRLAQASVRQILAATESAVHRAMISQPSRVDQLMTQAQGPRSVHRFEASLFPVNAYLVETTAGVVVVDGTLGVSDGQALRARVAALEAPLAAVLITHSHPDHYGGVAPMLDGVEAPVYAVAGVDRVIRRDDEAKEAILRPMFGAEWAPVRKFPTHIVRDGERVTIGDAVFTVTDLGPNESPHDSLWRLESAEGPPCAFIGDLVYSRMHAYLADGFYDRWLANLARAKRELPEDITMYMGHGEPVSGLAALDWQAGYIERFVDVLRSASERDGLRGEPLADAVCLQMKTLLPTDDLLFLLRLSVEPMRARLAAPSV